MPWQSRTLREGPLRAAKAQAGLGLGLQGDNNNRGDDCGADLRSMLQRQRENATNSAGEVMLLGEQAQSPDAAGSASPHVHSALPNQLGNNGADSGGRRGGQGIALRRLEGMVNAVAPTRATSQTMGETADGRLALRLHHRLLH